jgi:photosynthetic reaction center cytochrome c subunit
MKTATMLIVLLCGATWAQQPPAPTPPQKEKTAGETYKNVQVMKDVPASQWLPTMGFIAGALGVGCDHCHVNPFSEDKKPEKKKAREMMRMVAAINQQYFGDMPGMRVNCQTCHRGSTKPAKDLTFDQAGWLKEMAAKENPPAPAPATPEAQTILDKYRHAIGDAAHAGARTYRGHATNYNASAQGPIAIQLEVTLDGDKIRISQVTANGTTLAVFDGTHGWFNSPQGQHEMDAGDIATLRERMHALQVDYLPKYTAAKTTGTDNVHGHPAWVVELTTEAGPQWASFDQQSGYLLKLMRLVDTAFGTAPNELQLDDYRKTGSVKLPYMVLTGGVANGAVRKFDEIKTDVTLDAATFAQPPAPPKKP